MYAGSAVSPVLAAFRPDAVVCQCGADGLAGDPLGTFSLTPAGLGRCLTRLLAARRPTLLLGGGGYHPANVARCWALLTATVLRRQLPSDIPDHQVRVGHDIPDHQVRVGHTGPDHQVRVGHTGPDHQVRVGLIFDCGTCRL